MHTVMEYLFGEGLMLPSLIKSRAEPVTIIAFLLHWPNLTLHGLKHIGKKIEKSKNFSTEEKDQIKKLVEKNVLKWNTMIENNIQIFDEKLNETIPEIRENLNLNNSALFGDLTDMPDDIENSEQTIHDEISAYKAFGKTKYLTCKLKQKSIKFSKKTHFRYDSFSQPKWI